MRGLQPLVLPAGFLPDGSSVAPLVHGDHGVEEQLVGPRNTYRTRLQNFNIS